MTKPIIGLLSFCLLATLAGAEVYKSIDEDGKVIYTDNPRGAQAAEKVDLPSINRQPAIHVPPVEKTEKPDIIRHSIAIVAPADGSQIPTGQANVQVLASVQPFFDARHRIRFIHNGKTAEKPSKSPRILLSSIHRGEHQVSAQIINKNGKVIASSKSVTFYVQRHSVNR
ncbi:MAG: DUF4124 domain-containing protein [Cellvibrionaceae bacterium]